MMTPTRSEPAVANEPAIRLRTYPTFRAAAFTSSRVFSAMGPFERSTRETVISLTPASRATSARVMVVPAFLTRGFFVIGVLVAADGAFLRDVHS